MSDLTFEEGTGHFVAGDSPEQASSLYQRVKGVFDAETRVAAAP